MYCVVLAYTQMDTQHKSVLTMGRRQLLLHPFNGLFSTTTWVTWYRKGKRWWGLGMQWHQLDHMQTICTSLQTDNHTNTSSPSGQNGQKNKKISKPKPTFTLSHTTSCAGEVPFFGDCYFYCLQNSFGKWIHCKKMDIINIVMNN